MKPGQCAIAGGGMETPLNAQIWNIVSIACIASVMDVKDIRGCLLNIPSEVRETIIQQFLRIADAGNDLRPIED